MQKTLCMIAGGCLTLLVGCHSSPYYGQPQYFGSPGMSAPASGFVQPGTTYGAPGGTYAPPGGTYVPQGGTYVPEGTVPSNGPTLLTPTPTPNNPTSPNWRPDPNSGGSAQPFNNNPPSTFGAPPNDRTVPNPLDTPFDVSPGANKDPFPKTGLNRPSDPFPPANSPVTLDPLIETRRETPALASTTDSAMRATSNTRSIPQPVVDPTRPNPYDYDRSNYAWLRGVVDFDPSDQTWHIIYNLTPGKDDDLGGSVALVVDPNTTKLSDRSLVQVEAVVDPNQRDKTGKPMYRVIAAHPLTPRNH